MPRTVHHDDYEPICDDSEILPLNQSTERPRACSLEPSLGACRLHISPSLQHQKDRSSKQQDGFKSTKKQNLSFHHPKHFFFLEAFRPVWPRRCIVLSLNDDDDDAAAAADDDDDEMTMI